MLPQSWTTLSALFQSLHHSAASDGAKAPSHPDRALRGMGNLTPRVSLPLGLEHRVAMALSGTLECERCCALHGAKARQAGLSPWELLSSGQAISSNVAIETALRTVRDAVLEGEFSPKLGEHLLEIGFSPEQAEAILRHTILGLSEHRLHASSTLSRRSA